jgi:hypothetical protein
MGLFRLVRMVGTALALFAMGRRLVGQFKDMQSRKGPEQGRGSDYTSGT